MSVIIDILLIAVIVLFIILGAKKGFLAVAITFAGYVASIVLAFYLSSALSNVVYNQFFKTSVETKVYYKIHDLDITKNIDRIFEDAVQIIPYELRAISIKNAAPEDKAAINAAAQKDGIGIEVSNAIANIIIAPVIKMMITAILLFIIALILMMLVRMIAKHIRLDHIPILGPINAVLGGAMGILNGILVLYVILTISTAILMITSYQIPLLSKEVLNQSFIYKTFLQFSFIK